MPVNCPNCGKPNRLMRKKTKRATNWQLAPFKVIHKRCKYCGESYAVILTLIGSSYQGPKVMLSGEKIV